MIGIRIGTVQHYDPTTRTANVALTSKARRGDWLHILGPQTDMELRLNELITQGVSAIAASRGDEVVIALPAEVQAGDDVFRLVGLSLSEEPAASTVERSLRA